MLQDLRYAIRTLIKNPAFTIAAVLCLALGIGVNATVFSCVQALMLRPFPYKNPDELVAIGESVPKRGFSMNSVSYPNFRSWQSGNHTLVSMGIYTGNSFNLATDDAAEFVPGGSVSWTMFRTLGVSPVIGRDFNEGEDAVGAPRVIIIGDRLWREKFASRKDVAGQQLMINGIPHTIIGVMPAGFGFPSVAEAWTPMRTDPDKSRGNHSWQVIGRLKPGEAVAPVLTDLRAIASQLETQFPQSNTGWSVDVQTLREFQSGQLKPVLLIMMASVTFVLLIACANVANLLLARASARSKEMAVRVALGADRWRIVRQLLTESVLISLIGATFGIAFAYGFLQWVKSNILGLRFWMHFDIDGTVLLFTATVAIATGFIFGLVPALQSANPNLNDTLRDSGARGTSAGRGRQRLRSALVVAEIALSLVLLVGASLMIKSFVGLQRVNPGFDAEQLLTMSVSLNGPSYDSVYKRFNFWERALRDLNSQPDIVSASIVNNLPLGGNNNNNFFDVEGAPVIAGSQPLLEIRWVSPRYLETMKIPLVRGRMFTTQEWADSTAQGAAAVVNEYMAKKFWGSADAALGKRFSFGSSGTNPRWNTIVGVAADIKHKRLTSDNDFQGYMPYRQGGWSSSAIVVRTRASDPTQATRTVIGALRKMDPHLPTYAVRSMKATIEQSYWQQTLYGKMFGAFAAIALLLASVGVYGVISYTVSQRTQEIGVRVALGAQGGDVVRLVVGQGAVLGGIGVAIGLVGAFGVTRFLRTLLVGVSPFDVSSFVGVAVTLSGIALMASYLPARRASRVDPVEALRAE